MWNPFKKAKRTQAHKNNQQYHQLPKSLRDLDIEERSQIEDLLHKLLLMERRLDELQLRFVRPMIGMSDIMDHPDTLKVMFEHTKGLNEIFNVIQQDSYQVIDHAVTIKRRVQINQTDEIPQQDLEAFDKVLNMKADLQWLNDQISFCLDTIKEIHSAADQKDRIVHEHEVHQDLTDMSTTLQAIKDKMHPITTSLGHISHVDRIHKPSITNIRKALRDIYEHLRQHHDIQNFKQDITTAVIPQIKQIAQQHPDKEILNKLADNSLPAIARLADDNTRIHEIPTAIAKADTVLQRCATHQDTGQ